jgi:hypothetical protein
MTPYIVTQEEHSQMMADLEADIRDERLAEEDLFFEDEYGEY